MTAPRVALAHRVLSKVLEAAGLTLPVPDPEAGVLEMAPAWLDTGAEGVALLAGRRWPVATVTFSPSHLQAEVRVHVAQLATSPAEQGHPELVADVAIGPAVLADLGIGAPP